MVERASNILANSELIEAINYNQFAYFMLSNLLTGVVNLAM